MSETRYALHACFSHDLKSHPHRWNRLTAWLAERGLTARFQEIPLDACAHGFEVVVQDLDDARVMEFIVLFTPITYQAVEALPAS